MIRCLVIDDEPLAMNQMAGYVEKTPFLELAGKLPSAMQAIDFLSGRELDLIFVDIQMPDLSGMEFVRSLVHKPMIIFTTAYSEYAVEGFKVDAVDYLLKPISYTDFLKAAQKAKSQFDIRNHASISSEKDYLFVKSEYRVIRINFAEILYIEGMREYVRIHLIHDKPIMSLLSMKSLVRELPDDQFMQVHKSFIVNLSQIKIVERSRIVFGDVYIPIGDAYKEDFQKYLDDKFLGR
jgi:DNA-binding LytR/AlgR family response regulator